MMQYIEFVFGIRVMWWFFNRFSEFDAVRSSHQIQYKIPMLVRSAHSGWWKQTPAQSKTEDYTYFYDSPSVSGKITFELFL